MARAVHENRSNTIVPASGKKVVVTMSGGVDSSVAACLLQQQGYDVTGLFMRTGIESPEAETCSTDGVRHRGCCSAADAADARAVAGRIGIPFFALNFAKPFDRIITYFADEYARGRTPNPCIICNDDLKFGHLAEYGQTVGADFIATGHYARIVHDGDNHRLCRGLDADKDQSYVLFGLPKEMLARTLLPVGVMTKDQVRNQARQLGLQVSDKPDSQDICFAPDRDYARVVREKRPDAFSDGAIIDSAGKELGRHEGIANYTIGQRRGLNIAMGYPIYVTRIDPDTNTVTVGPADELVRDSLEAARVNWLIEPPTEPFDAHVQIRYNHCGAAARVTPLPDQRVKVEFAEAQRAVTPGQAAVFYDNDTVLGGGWIE